MAGPAVEVIIEDGCFSDVNLTKAVEKISKITFTLIVVCRHEDFIGNVSVKEIKLPIYDRDPEKVKQKIQEQLEKISETRPFIAAYLVYNPEGDLVDFNLGS